MLVYKAFPKTIKINMIIFHLSNIHFQTRKQKNQVANIFLSYFVSVLPFMSLNCCFSQIFDIFQYLKAKIEHIYGNSLMQEEKDHSNKFPIKMCSEYYK